MNYNCPLCGQPLSPFVAIDTNEQHHMQVYHCPYSLKTARATGKRSFFTMSCPPLPTGADNPHNIWDGGFYTAAELTGAVKIDDGAMVAA